MYFINGIEKTNDFEYYKSKSTIKPFSGDEKYFSICYYKNIYKIEHDKKYFQEVMLIYNPN